MNKAANNRAPTFVDVFAGCGGLSLGLMQAGWKGLFAIERDENAFATLKHNLLDPKGALRFAWPRWLPKKTHDIHGVLEQHIEELRSLRGKLDMLVGGPPCQGFSTAGRRDPNDPRNRLVRAYLEFVSEVRPKVVLIENVRGITLDFSDERSPSGKVNYAQWIIDELSGLYDVSARLIDTSLFGVPQNRQRFFIIGILKGKKSFGDPFGTVEKMRVDFLKGKGISTIPISSKTAISDLEVFRNEVGPSRDTVGFNEIKYKKPLTSFQKLMNKGANGHLRDTRLARHKPEIEHRFKQLIDICSAEGRLNVSLSSELKLQFGLKKCAIRVLDPDRPSPTITSMPDDLIHYAEPRILTVRENARLQTFPDWFAFQGKYTSGGMRRRAEVPRFTQVANAVPPLAAELFGIAIKAHCFNLPSV
ncbi:DNA cytosine methyltransferase [Pararobbsia silviterrae]|uniref:Cytosine-specific methyltransferase n=1 Tax=Pararobbsia silviterrae TaxID=1792498 RepID=A0A494X0B8_9BURK|nr:DNA cytosine methyltransferase [Pararobbsia silviterrae]RKP43780.1 DNA cytosine methyltransferase [Pararobbsia silviterrae]